jgi:predicted nucleic acid-binding protein
MAGADPVYYWDTCLFLAWIKDEERRTGEMDGVREIIERSRHRECKIVTSVLTQVEVLQGRMPAGIPNLFVNLMKRVTRLGVDSKVASLAHDIREAVQVGGRTLSTPDAIHLATAVLHRVNEFHTFDDGLLPLSGNVGGHRLTVCKPQARNPGLDLRRPRS